MIARQVAAERRLDALLGEALQPSGEEAVVQRTLLRLHELPAAPAARAGSRLVAAAWMLVGALVVVAVAWQRHGPDAAAARPQEPQPGEVPQIVVSDADLPPASRFDLAAGADVHGELLRIAAAVAVPIVVDGSVGGRLRAAAPQRDWRAALAALAASAGAGIEELDGVLVVRPDPQPLAFGATITLRAKDVGLADFARAVAGQTGVALVVAGDARGNVQCRFQAAPWRAALDLVAARAGCAVEGCGKVFVLRRVAGPPPVPPRASYDFDRVPLTTVIDALAQFEQWNVVMGPLLADAGISLRGNGVGGERLLPALARAAGLVCWRDRHVRILQRDGGGQSLPPATVAAEAVDLRTFAELVRSSAQTEVGVPADCAARLSVFAVRAPVADLVAAAARAAGRPGSDDPKRGLRIH